MTPDRGTAVTTILFTDLVNSTQLMHRAGDEDAQRIFKAHYQPLRNAVSANGGSEVKSLGGGLMVAFGSAADAVHCAIMVQQASRRGTGRERLAVKVGINAGEAMSEGEDYFGTPVVAARRLCDRAPWIGDADSVIDEVQEFVTGVRPAAEMGDRRWRDVLEEYYGLARHELGRFRGREIKTTGDGFLATFDGPARGIRCACAITDAVRSLGIQTRAGLHAGECELLGEDIGGLAVHIANRVGGLAGRNEVLVSSRVKDLVVGSGIEFQDRGEHALKGVPDQWRLFGVPWRE